jgi:hypothetical protein
MTDRYLVLFDADRIRDYVFASGRLREIRGASERVRQMTDPAWLHDEYGTWTPNDPDGPGVIFAGGGAGAIVVESEELARDACELLERRFRQGTGGATLSAVHERIDPNLNRIDAEADAQTRAARALARRKASRSRTQLVPGGLVRFCGSDRTLPAIGTSPIPHSSDQLPVSHATATRRIVNQTYKTSLQRQAYWKAFRAGLPADDITAWVDAISPDQDMGSIGRQSDPDGYVALVYADGDRIGGTLRDIVRRHGFAGYQRFSAALDTAAHRATARALLRAYGARPPRKHGGETALPFDVITVGGDDILLLCTAGSGLQIACDLARFFGEEMTAALSDRNDGLPGEQAVTASVGVVIAHDTMPVLTLERVGRELLKSAKQVRGGGGVDFHVATASGIDRLAASRAREHQTGTPGLPSLTRRPYELGSALDLLHHAERIRGAPAGGVGDDRGLPTSKVAELIAACKGDETAAALAVLGVHSRLAAGPSQKLTDALVALDSVARYPFADPDADGRQSTALLDLLEASQFTGEEWAWI